CLVVEKVLREKLLLEALEPVGIQQPVLQLTNCGIHQLQCRIGRSCRHVETASACCTIEEGSVHVVCEILARSNFGEHPAGEHRGGDSERLIVFAVGERTAVVADDV